MNSEQVLLEKWRTLPSDRQREVLDFIDGIIPRTENKESDRTPSGDRADRVRAWLDWAEDNPKPSPNLPDEAMHRDTIYDR
jgi:hypothetical protein